MSERLIKTYEEEKKSKTQRKKEKIIITKAYESRTGSADYSADRYCDLENEGNFDEGDGR